MDGNTGVDSYECSTIIFLLTLTTPILNYTIRFGVELKNTLGEKFPANLNLEFKYYGSYDVI
jgi:hypothetical protein